MSTDAKTKQSKRTAYEALGSEVRLDIVMRLAQGELSVARLAKEIGATQALVSGHLKKLADAGFVGSRAEGKFRHYFLNEEFAAPFLAALDAGWSPKSSPHGILRGIVGQLPISLLVTDRRGTVLLAAGQPLRKHDASPAAHAGRSILDLFDDRKSALVSLSGAFRGETVHWTASSAGAELRLLSIPYKDARGRCAGAITVGFELPPHADAARHVAEEGEWKLLAQTMDGAVTQFAADGTIQAHTRSLTQPDHDFTGTNFWENVKVLDSASRKAAEKAFTAALKTGQMTEYRVVTKGRDGDRHFECRAVPHWSAVSIDGVTIITREVHAAAGPDFFVK
ncbi:MAG TPA: metalloregulator ArsR/SmtB family transcription factor [Candidatus Binatia bacterium]|jgi:DNA-binding transcriptional ArsR family regulator|nr:metalloregulator ArsR/SmtB family transcription factor [Candidatus Binatia bacterium]